MDHFLGLNVAVAENSICLWIKKTVECRGNRSSPSTETPFVLDLHRGNIEVAKRRATTNSKMNMVTCCSQAGPRGRCNKPNPCPF